MQATASPFGLNDQEIGDADATRKVNTFRLEELAASIPDETSPFPIPDAKQVAAAMPTPSSPFMPVAPSMRGAERAASDDAKRSVRLGLLVAVGMLLVAAGVGAIALGAQLLR